MIIVKMKIGIIGVGVVGNAIKKYYEKKNKYTVLCYDKYKDLGSFNDVLTSNILFLCLPTPFVEDKYDISELENTCKLLNGKKDINIILKSTVTPGTTEYLENKYNINIIHNPEFISQKTATEDFENQYHIILGCNNKEKLKNIETFYKTDFPDCEYTLTTPKESELTKLALNNFYCVKIQFFTEMYLLCDKLGINYDNIKNTMLKNKWIHPNHTQIPGRDGQVSYGGMCFPKDSNALYSFMKETCEHYKVLEATIKERNILRN